MATWAIVLHDKIIKRFNIGEGMTLSIGRGSEADVMVDNTAISRKHSAFALRDGTYYVSDLGSLNGTYVNGTKVTTPVPVSEKDTIDIGKFRLIAGGDLDKENAASFATPMDIEEETVFIGPKQAAKLRAPENQPPPGKPKHSLTRIDGKATPNFISLDGKSSIKIGKDASADCIISGWFVAAAQCYIIRRDENYLIVPQSSWAATRLNNIKIKNEQVLRKGDIIEISSTKIRFE